jgi:RecB family exonuclease
VTTLQRVFRISPFRLKVFRRCRRQYKYRYVEHIPPGPNASDTMGSHVHSALRDLMQLPEHERTGARAADLLRAHWASNRAGFSGLADEARWRARALEQVQRFAEMSQVHGRPVAVEQYLEVDVAEHVRVIGRIDRIDEDGGDLQVIDYKTSRQPEEADPEQLHLYAMMLRRFADRPVTAASFVYLEDGSDWSIQPDAAEMEQTTDAVIDAVGEMTQERDYLPSVGRHCAFCDFQRICPKRDEIVGRRLTEGW